MVRAWAWLISLIPRGGRGHPSRPERGKGWQQKHMCSSSCANVWGFPDAIMESYILKSTCFRCTSAKIVLGLLGKTETFQLGENFPRHGAANHTTYGILSHTPEITWNTEGKHCQNCTFNETPSSIKTWVLCLWDDRFSIILFYFPPNKWLECWSYAVSSGHKWNVSKYFVTWKP